MHFSNLRSLTSTAIFPLECPNLVSIYGESQINTRKKIDFKEGGEKRKNCKEGEKRSRGGRATKERKDMCSCG